MRGLGCSISKTGLKKSTPTRSKLHNMAKEREGLAQEILEIKKSLIDIKSWVGMHQEAQSGQNLPSPPVAKSTQGSSAGRFARICWHMALQFLEALVVLMHDMGPNWELISDAINSTLQFKICQSQNDMSKVLGDQSFVSSILASLPGVNPNDPSVKDLLVSLQGQTEQKKDEDKPPSEGEK
ncbi:26S proteasome non-ATPase regulatory subunit 4 homolog [Magnolia sinica]|uniref:26S proteasome non-ATPase regulatory subunit 4 homolog n=1 Tax=Magnolia sinica TaxID=86752 RepID=UPI00265A9E43|nr:26S proteasome non-ATPase regulatory subunit 4 homolog [Magnolia sinica]